MAFKNGAFATLWNVDKQNQKLINFYDKYADIQISTSKKNSQNRYENDFMGKVRCFGHALEVLKSVQLAEKDRVKLLEVEVTNKYDAATKKTYMNYTCWDLEVPANTPKKAPEQPEVIGDFTPVDELPSGELPF